MIGIGSCRRDMEDWHETEENQDVALYVRAAGEGHARLAVSGYQVFLYDKENKQTTRHEIRPDGSDDGRFTLGISPGNFSGFCLANLADNSLLDYEASSVPKNIFVSLVKGENGTYQETEDYFLGNRDFVIDENTKDPIVFDLQRKVAQLRVKVENIPVWMNRLAVNVASIPVQMNLEGSYSEETGVVSKELVLSAGNNRSDISLLLFPPREKCSMELVYEVEGISYTTPAHVIDTLQANRITEIQIIFRSSENPQLIDFYTNVLDWEEDIFRQDDWYIDVPGDVCKGEGNGVNLLKNGGFEEGNADTIPVNWKLDAGGADKKVVLTGTTVLSGKRAARLEGKTYLYQDVPVLAGSCYQLKMHVNALSETVKWRYWCTWMAGSKALASEEIRSSSYNYQTQGYQDVFEGKVFKAPAGATKLRMEIRSYTSPWTPGEGLYVDGVSVELVE